MTEVIKSPDVCARCVHGLNSCKGADCKSCEMDRGSAGCGCVMIRKNTPCPHFKEAEKQW